MANSSDWIAQFGAPPKGDPVAGGSPVRAGWLAALALDEHRPPGGFRDASPFAPPAKDTAPQTIEELPLPEPAPQRSSEEDPEAKGFLRGFAEGHGEAKRAGEAELAAERERFRDLRLAFRKLDADALDALAQDLNATVLALCKQVLGDYALDHEALAQRCRSAAARLGAGPGEAILHLNPETLATLDPDAFADWTLAEDPALPLGSLRVTNADGSVRDGLEDWMRALGEGLGS